MFFQIMLKIKKASKMNSEQPCPLKILNRVQFFTLNHLRESHCLRTWAQHPAPLPPILSHLPLLMEAPIKVSVHLTVSGSERSRIT